MSSGSAGRPPARPPRHGPDRLLLRAGFHGGPAVALLVVTAVSIAAAETALPAVLGHAIDGALHGRHGGLLGLGALIMAIVVGDALDELATAKVMATSTAWVRNTLIGHIARLGTAARTRWAPGDLVGRIVGNSSQVARVTVSAARALANLLPAIGGPVGLALIDPWLCLTFLAGLPVLYILVRVLTREIHDVAEGYLAAQGEIAGRLVEVLGGVRTVASAGKLDAEAGRILEPLGRLHEHGVGLWRAQMRMIAQNGLLVSLLEVAVLAVAGFELSAGRITAGQMLAAAQYVLLGATMTSVLSSVAAFAQARAAAARIAEVLAEDPPSAGSAAAPAGPGHLEFRAVSVYRQGRSVLRNISLELRPGTFTAIVGASGAGKTTLAAVAGRLIDPDEGDVWLDGIPLRTLSSAELRRVITYGFEDPHLIGETLADAIAFGTDRPPLWRLVEAACDARADDFVRRLPRRYATPLADLPLSGGERQRLGLARTFAHGGRVMILDDVAASLDTVTEHHISAALLSGALSDRTRLVVAHRASTAAAADVVVWLAEGAVRAIGSHADLWRDPAYRTLFAAEESTSATSRVAELVGGR